MVGLQVWHDGLKLYSFFFIILLFYIYPNASQYDNNLFSFTLFLVSNGALFLTLVLSLYIDLVYIFSISLTCKSKPPLKEDMQLQFHPSILFLK